MRGRLTELWEKRKKRIERPLRSQERATRGHRRNSRRRCWTGGKEEGSCYLDPGGGARGRGRGTGEGEEAEGTQTALSSAYGYRPPPLSLFESPPPGEATTTPEELSSNSAILEQKLLDFGVEGKVTEVHPGPVITRYELEPAPGIKVNRIVNLADDLALALKALSVRVIAPIPGKAVVGVEIPNKNRAIVYVKEILSSSQFQNSPSLLSLALRQGYRGQSLRGGSGRRCPICSSRGPPAPARASASMP